MRGTRTETAGEPRAISHDAAHSVGMRLDQLPADQIGQPQRSPGQPDLASSPAEKKAAANAIEGHIEPDTKKAGSWADDEMDAVVKAFAPKDGHGWLVSGAVSKAHKTWGEQVQSLMFRLSSEKAALRATNNLLMGTDIGVGSGLRQPSALDQY